MPVHGVRTTHVRRYEDDGTPLATTAAEALMVMHGSSAPAWNHDRNGPLLGPAEETKLVLAAHCGDRRASGILVEAHMKLVHAIARRVTSRPSEDVISEGVVGLLEGIARFDCTRGVRLATYASHWIRARVQSFVLANRGIVGSPGTRAARRVFAQLGRARRALATQASEPGVEQIAAAIGVKRADVEGVLVAISPRDVAVGADASVGQFEPSSHAPSPEDALARREVADARGRAIADVLATLPPRDRRVVEARALAEDARTLEDLANELHLSRERVRQLEMRALRCIGDTFVARGLAA